MKKKDRDEKASEDHEGIRYDDVNVRELLTYMKDNSELIADLAYAAVVVNERELADEVVHLEAEMDKMMYQIRVKSMLSARTEEDAERLGGLLQVASSAEKISDAAEDMVEILEMDTDLENLLPHALERADEKVAKIAVDRRSTLKGKQIRELGIESVTGVRVIAIRRGDRWIYGPGGDDIIREGDRLICSGPRKGIENLKASAQGKKDWKKVKR